MDHSEPGLGPNCLHQRPVFKIKPVSEQRTFEEIHAGSTYMAMNEDTPALSG